MRLRVKYSLVVVVGVYDVILGGCTLLGKKRGSPKHDPQKSVKVFLSITKFRPFLKVKHNQSHFPFGVKSQFADRPSSSTNPEFDSSRWVSVIGASTWRRSLTQFPETSWFFPCLFSSSLLLGSSLTFSYLRYL